MRALGASARSPRAPALTEQLAFYKKGEGAWSALDALARLAQPSSVPLFKERLTDKDPNIRRAAAEGLGRAGDASAAAEMLERRHRRRIGDGAHRDGVRAAEARTQLRGAHRRRYGLAAHGASRRRNTWSSSGRRSRPPCIPHLQESDAGIREGVAEVLGVDRRREGAAAAAGHRRPDRDPNVATAAKRAIERIEPCGDPAARPSTTVRRWPSPAI